LEEEKELWHFENGEELKTERRGESRAIGVGKTASRLELGQEIWLRP
jgi:hypothetical protein